MATGIKRRSTSGLKTDFKSARTNGGAAQTDGAAIATVPSSAGGGPARSVPGSAVDLSMDVGEACVTERIISRVALNVVHRIAGDFGGDARRRVCFADACASFLGSSEYKAAQQKYANLLTDSSYTKAALPMKIAACKTYIQTIIDAVAAVGGVRAPIRIPLMTAVRPALTAAELRHPVVLVLGTAAHKGAVSANDSDKVAPCGYKSATANILQIVQNAAMAAFPPAAAPALVIVNEDVEEEEHVEDDALGTIAPDVTQAQKCTPLVAGLLNGLLAAIGAGGGRVAVIVASGGGDRRIRRLLEVSHSVPGLEAQKTAALLTMREVVLPHLTHAAPGAAGGHRDTFDDFAAVALQLVVAITGSDGALALQTAREAARYASSAREPVLAAAFLADAMDAVLAGDIARAAGLVHEAQAAAFAATAQLVVLEDLARIHRALSSLGDPDAPVPLLDWVDSVLHKSFVDPNLGAHVDAAFDAAEALGSAHYDASSREKVLATAKRLADGEYLQYRLKHPVRDGSAKSGGSYLVALCTSTMAPSGPSGIYPGSVTSGQDKPHDTLVEGRHDDRKGALRAGGNDGLKKARHQPDGTWAGGTVVTHSLSTNAGGDTFEVTRYVEAVINFVVHLILPSRLLTTRKSEYSNWQYCSSAMTLCYVLWRMSVVLRNISAA